MWVLGTFKNSHVPVILQPETVAITCHYQADWSSSKHLKDLSHGRQGGESRVNSICCCIHQGILGEINCPGSLELSHAFSPDTLDQSERKWLPLHTFCMHQSHISVSAGLCLVAYSGSGGIMVWVVSEHSSCAVMGMFSTAFRHLALMMFCMPCGQLGGFFSFSFQSVC